jgi:mannosyl-3-phosphoglycerate phosphatase
LSIDEHPFIVENGGAVYIPAGYFGARPADAHVRGEYEVIQFGRPYPELVSALREAAAESGCPVLGFHDMTVADLAVRSRLPVRQAVLAKEREYDEPFEILGSGTYRLLGEIERRDLAWTRGDRFYHLNGGHDKADAVRRLLDLYRQSFGSVFSIGIGDGHNDAKFLGAVSAPVLIQSRYTAVLRRAVPSAIVSFWPGPDGWNEAVLRALSGAANERPIARASAG